MQVTGIKPGASKCRKLYPKCAEKYLCASAVSKIFLGLYPNPLIEGRERKSCPRTFLKNSAPNVVFRYLGLYYIAYRPYISLGSI
jgi:hypothetical protein